VTPRTATGGHWAALRHRLRDRPVLLGILPLLVLMIVGISVMSDYSRRVNAQLERLQTAQADNTTWIISQTEVDFLRLRSALSDAISVPAGEAAAEELAEVRRAFDIAYSRVAVIEGRDFGLDAAGDDRLIAAWDWMRGYVTDRAATIDQDDDALRGDLGMLKAELANNQVQVRYFAVSGLQEMIRRSTEDRVDLKQLLSNFSLIAVVMILVLVGIVWVLALLYRGLERRAQMAERAISNLQTMIEASLDAVIVLDAEGRVTHFNSAAAMIFGYTPDEALGRDMGGMCLPERFRADHRNAMQRFLRTGQGNVANKGRVLLTAMRQDGREFPVEAAVVSDRNADGDPIFIGFVRDVSDRMRIENSLRQARDDAMQSARAKSRFLAVMSHEMRTPLNGVIAALDVIERTTRLSAKQAQFLTIARSCSSTALDQIGDVLELTRLEDGQQIDRAVAFDLATVTGQIVAQSQPLAKARDNVLAFRLAPDLEGRRLNGYQRLLSRVLINLIGNAIKFTEHGRVTVRALIEAEEADTLTLRFEVTDTGIGIPFDKQTRIFENFEQIDDSYARTAEGTGLGLGIARRAVEAMGGEIGVVSSVGKGSTFWFTARFRPAGPVEPGAGEHPADRPGKRLLPVRKSSGEPLDVLIAEDNEINRIVLREMLQTLGHRVVIAENGRQAVQHAAQHAFDLILMDISMPEMDGIEAAERIRTSGGPSARARLVAVTAHALKEDIEEFEQSGLDTVLTKPVTYDALVRTIAPTGPDATAAAGETVAEAAAPASALDHEVLEEAREMLGPDGFAGLAQHYLDETEDRIATILDQVHRNAADGLAETIHIVAGSSAVMGATRLAGLMRDCESRVRSDGAGALAARVEEIAAAWAETEAAIRAAAEVPAT